MYGTCVQVWYVVYMYIVCVHLCRDVIYIYIACEYDVDVRERGYDAVLAKEERREERGERKKKGMKGTKEEKRDVLVLT